MSEIIYTKCLALFSWAGSIVTLPSIAQYIMHYNYTVATFNTIL